MLVESRLKMNMRSAVECEKWKEKKLVHIYKQTRSHTKLEAHMYKNENHAWKIEQCISLGSFSFFYHHFLRFQWVAKANICEHSSDQRSPEPAKWPKIFITLWRRRRQASPKRKQNVHILNPISLKHRAALFSNETLQKKKIKF